MALKTQDEVLVMAFNSSANGSGQGFNKFEKAVLELLSANPGMTAHWAVNKAKEMFHAVDVCRGHAFGLD